MKYNGLAALLLAGGMVFAAVFPVYGDGDKATTTSDRGVDTNATKKDPPPSADVKDPTQDIWKLLLQNRVEELRRLDAQAITFNEQLPDLSVGLQQEVGDIEKDYQRLMTIARISRGLPLELSVVRERLAHLEDRLHAALAPLDGALNTLKTQVNDISFVEQDAPSPEEEASSPELRAFLADLNATQSRLNLVQLRMNRILRPARQLGDGVAALQTKLDHSIPSLWQEYYLNRVGRIYDPDAWLNLQKSFTVLQETFTMRMSAELPVTLSGWIGVFLRGLILFVPLRLFLYGSRRWSQHWPEPLPSGWERLSSHSLSWLALGFTFHFAAWSGEGTYTYHVLSVIGTLLLSFGQMALAWDLYTFGCADFPKRSPLWPLFAPLLSGLVLLLFNLPGALLGGLWLIVLGVTLWRDHKRPLPDIPFPLVINLLQFQAVVLWLAVLMTLLGWGRLSILVCMAYAALAVCLQQAIGFMRLTNAISQYLPKVGLKALLSSFILALALPALLVFATLATGLWILAYPGGQFLLAHAAQMDFSVGKTTFNLIQVLFILSAFYVTRSFISVGRAFIAELPSHGMRLEQSIVGPVQVAFTYLLWGMFGLYTLNALGFSLTSLAVVAGGLSVGIGFGLQNIINNFVSGLLIIFGQTLREGDIIEVGEKLTGTVKRINVRSTMVETPDNAIIFVPNAEFLSGRLTNWTRNGRMARFEIAIGVAYGSDVQLVIRLLQEAAKAHPKVLSYPEPFVVFQDFGASSLDFLLRFWVGDIQHGLEVTSELRIAIDKTFTANKIEISFPQLDVHLRENETVPVSVLSDSQINKDSY